MSDTNTETKPAGKAPTHVAYHVRDAAKARRASGHGSGPPGHTPTARASISSSKSRRWTAASASASLRKRKSNGHQPGRAHNARPQTGKETTHAALPNTHYQRTVQALTFDYRGIRWSLRSRVRQRIGRAGTAIRRIPSRPGQRIREATMHHLMLATLSLPDGGTSEKAREAVYSPAEPR